MVRDKSQPLIITRKDRCRVCYTCVRECPAKAIRIVDGQAEVIAERCIGCGNCVKVCSQKAKVVLSSIEEVYAILDSEKPVAALIAPSYPADFTDIDSVTFVGMVRQLGFTYVNEVGFGADLVAREMRRLMTETDDPYISTPCPAVFGYIKRYHPELIGQLAPVVSPMIATARALKQLHGADLKTVFIGPCIAKMGEAYSDEVAGEIDEVLTFQELHRMFKEKNIDANAVEPIDFDPPHAGLGSLFPIRRGLLEAAEIKEDLLTNKVVSANGKENFIDAIMEFGRGELNARLLDVLCCDGCIMGAGMTTKEPLYKRRTRVSNAVRSAMEKRNADELHHYMEKFRNLDLRRTFLPFDQRLPEPASTEVEEVLARMGKFKPEDELNCGACGYETCREHAKAILKGLAESEMCLPYTIEKLHNTIAELNQSYEKLDDTKAALAQAEKLASMGQLAAGIAHEVNNPLGVVLMYAHLLREECPPDSEMAEDIKMVVEQADRCKNIVSGLLDFARQSKVQHKAVNIVEMIENVLRIIKPPTGISLTVEKNVDDPIAEIDRDQMIQVITNLVNNSITAMPDGGNITVGCTGDDSKIVIFVKDTGTGIPKEHLSKIFEPFFTTKKVGQGTGLGLSIIYGIVKMHNGDIGVESNADPTKGPTGTTFRITLPRRRIIKRNHNLKGEN